MHALCGTPVGCFMSPRKVTISHMGVDPIRLNIFYLLLVRGRGKGGSVGASGRGGELVLLKIEEGWGV